MYQQTSYFKLLNGNFQHKFIWTFFISHIDDPKNLGRSGVVCLIDSTLVETQVSSDHEVQKSTHSSFKGGHFIKITAISQPDGTVVLYSTASVATARPSTSTYLTKQKFLILIKKNKGRKKSLFNLP